MMIGVDKGDGWNLQTAPSHLMVEDYFPVIEAVLQNVVLDSIAAGDGDD